MTDLITRKNIDSLQKRVYQSNGEEIPFYIDNGVLYGSQDSISALYGIGVSTVSESYTRLAKLNGFDKKDKSVKYIITHDKKAAKTGVKTSTKTFYPLEIIIAIGKMKTLSLCELFKEWADEQLNPTEINDLLNPPTQTEYGDIPLEVRIGKYEPFDMSKCVPEMYVFGEMESVPAFVEYDTDNVWLSEKCIARLFDTTIENINQHINNIITEGQLNFSGDDLIYAKTFYNQQVRKWIRLYNLDMIIAVGYRVNSKQAIAFRKWATNLIHKYLTKGIAVNESLLASNPELHKNAVVSVMELKTRLDEHNDYDKLRHLLKTTADYRTNPLGHNKYYSTIQNMIHYAFTQRTAKQLVIDRADARKPYCGLVSIYTNGNTISPAETTLTKHNMTSAKNYLTEEELNDENRLVNTIVYNVEMAKRNGRDIYLADILRITAATIESQLGYRMPAKIPTIDIDKHLDEQLKMYKSIN